MRYYRASPEYLGKKVTLTPTDYYEAIDPSGESSMIFDEYMESDIPEIAASKYIGGAVLGSFSMNRGKAIYYIYFTDSSPDVDISHWGGGDFILLEEVRFRKKTVFKYLGEVSLSEDDLFLFNLYYKQFEVDDADEYEDVYTEEDLEFFEENNIDEDFTGFVRDYLNQISTS